MLHLRSKPQTLIALALVTLMLAGCPSGDPYQQATTAVHKYAVSLQSFQSAEIKAAHDLDGSGQPYIDAALHRTLETDIKSAAKAGGDLDQGILIAKAGGDASSYIDAAFTTVDKINTDVALVKDDNKRAALGLALKAARMILVNGLQQFKH